MGVDVGWCYILVIVYYVIGFGDYLYVGIFDVIVYGFNEMICVIRIKVICVRFVVEFGGDGFDYGLDVVLCFWCVVYYNGWIVVCVFFVI